MELKPGYKKTEYGIFPEDWDLKPLGKLTSLLTNGFVGVATSHYVDNEDGVLYIQGYNVEVNGFNFRGIKRVSYEFHSQHQKSCLQEGDLLTIQTGDVGVTAVVPSSLKGANCHALIITRFLKNTVISSFYSQFFNSERGCSIFKKIEIGTTMKHVNCGDMAQLILPVPPIEEQRSISVALSDVDALIAGLEKLITKKRDIKQAAMQQLLTGQTRLPGFSGEWARNDLKNLVSTPVTDGPHLTPTFYETGVPFLSVNNLANNRIDWSDLRFISKADDEVFSRKCKPRKGDVLLGKAASVGKVAIVEADIDFNIWSPIALIRAGAQVNSKFLYYQLLSADCICQVMLLTNASSQGNIGMGDIEKLQISYPCYEEQMEIATVLADMDVELFGLETRLAKTRDLKQGMMQELLTGRTRLV
jgi:type I restriction enzyme S subunit